MLKNFVITNFLNEKMKNFNGNALENVGKNLKIIVRGALCAHRRRAGAVRARQPGRARAADYSAIVRRIIENFEKRQIVEFFYYEKC